MNAVEVRAERDGVLLEGYAGLPTHSRANSLGQYLFVNGRPVRDKLLIGVIRGAYADYLPRDRHPVAALFVTLPPREVDVNVHPAKTEVRFRDNTLVRALLMHALKEGWPATDSAPHHGGSATIAAFRPATLPHRGAFRRRRPPRGHMPPAPWRRGMRPIPVLPKPPRPCSMSVVLRHRPRRNDRAGARPVDRPLGAASAQVHDTYIVAQTRDGLVIVDQHAARAAGLRAHEAAIDQKGIARQILLIPEIVELDAADIERLLSRTDELKRFGLAIEPRSPGAIAVRETPSMLGEIDAARWPATSPSIWLNGTRRFR